jgi:hypothetical protein
MLTGKGLAYALIAAMLAGAAWVGLVELTGWSLWLLAPAIGGAAGYGMMRATQMRGGVVPGLAAAACCVAVILGCRAFTASRWVDAQTQEAAMNHVTELIAADLEAQDIEVLDDEGEYTAEVQRKAEQAWAGLSDSERAKVLDAVREESGFSEGGLFGIGLVFDFGLFGLICTGLAAATAFKTASFTLEQALQDKGLDSDEAAQTAQRLRAENKPSAADAA